MLKRIPKSDISIRPFKAYKEWSFDDTSNEISLFEANISSSELSNGVQKNSLYGQLRAQFYNGHEDNPFLRFGAKRNYYETAILAKERYFEDYAKIISIPQIAVGEGIKKFSVTLVDSSTTYVDDGYGNIQDPRDSVIVSLIDNQTNEVNFIDYTNIEYSTISPYPTTVFVDIQNEEIRIIYQGDTYFQQLVSYDVQSGILIADDLPFLPEAAQGIKIGNVFYTQGLIVLTRAAASRLNSDWTLDYKSTETIYENEFLLIVEPDEFNISQNPSAVVVVGEEKDIIEDNNGIRKKVVTNPGVKYIRKLSTLDNGNTLDFRYTSSINSTYAGFEHYDLSGSADSTGSFLTPFITTIGLYDDNCDLVAVAKLPQPIKSEPELPINFIVRFDT
jgi:hypothetical protein